MLMQATELSFAYQNGHRVNPVLEKIDLSIQEGETVGLLGKSGCGKSTLGKLLCGLLRPQSGTLEYRGERLGYPLKGQTRREIQILFQHPENSFDPRLSIYQALKEIYRLYRLPFSDEALCEMLAPFGIYEEHLHRRPAQLSGGELQRIALSRLLLAKPRLIVLDEPTSMLDSISQAQIIRMLMALQKQSGVSYLFITHDPLLCEIASHRIFTIEDQKIAERIVKP